MNTIDRWFDGRRRLDVFAGLVDGVLNALTLAAARLLRSDGGATLALAARVGAAAALTSLFVFFVAHYAEMRADLLRAERELNLSGRGRLAASALGREVLREAATGAMIASICSLAGAVIPLLLESILPGPHWFGLGVTIALLGVLGAAMAGSFHGRMLPWGCGVALGGIALTAIGLRLHLVDG